MHDLRHTFAHTMLKNGMLISEFSQIFLRHSTVAITERRYARFSREGNYSVVDRMNKKRLQ
ncbi:MAG: hypothetical protein JW885_12900 [Deltaproteobacteria bacterium]|nr:hypothetical protein [Candidatus Zymogenaceae bacterium]